MTFDSAKATERPPLSPPDKALAYVGGAMVLLWGNYPTERIGTAWRTAERTALGKPVERAFVTLTTNGSMFGHPLRMNLGELLLVPDHPKLGEILAYFNTLGEGRWDISVGARVARLMPPSPLWKLGELKDARAANDALFLDDDLYYVGLVVELKEKT